jgi:YesN/AraC family two-component response regulator
VHNYWLPVIVRRQTLALAYVQTLDLKAASPCACDHSRSPARRALSEASRKPAGKACRSAKRMSHAKFNRAARLLQLIFGYAESSTMSELRRDDLLKTQRALQELQTVATHLRQDLNGLMPSLNKKASDLQPLTRTERIAQAMLGYIHQHYMQPITLEQCAKTMELSRAYLSNLFSHRVGLPFKAYLTEIRLEKARELLGASATNISQVSAAVGYGSENRFRIAFRMATGLSPKAWREVFRTRRQPPSP